MLQVKIFSAATYDGDVAHLERAINEWLRTDAPAIRHVAQATHDAQLVLTFLCEEASTVQEATVEDTAEVPDVFERELGGTGLDPSETELPPLPDAELPY